MHEHEKWIRIAKEDLIAAKTLLEPELFSSVAYHCQQAAEKALKGYIAFKGHEILKSHDLIKLVDLCKKFDVDFDQIYGAAGYLTPHATKFRYPTESEIPDRADAEAALKYA
jgi:HEPN domain-containing protein